MARHAGNFIDREWEAKKQRRLNSGLSDDLCQQIMDEQYALAKRLSYLPIPHDRQFRKFDVIGVFHYDTKEQLQKLSKLVLSVIFRLHFKVSKAYFRKFSVAYYFTPDWQYWNSPEVKGEKQNV
jgi:hypothetical protein